ncbi:FadR/GntR family transcriptional regulator [Pseudonocardia aurantiaca]|uniref:FadR/GntR family transcriptional regulator n=1 Tax=Pseudonocardia aurantiaca TaxID=75290 RepID=A0ABW4FRN3_9PSEU
MPKPFVADEHPARPARSAAPADIFSRVSAGRISEVIVEQIRDLIRQGRLVPGSRLPAERELCDRFGVSRVTVREALRVLEASGLVDIRIGVRGGPVVTAPSTDRVGEGITDLVTMSVFSAVDVTEARRVLELGVIPLACERADAADLAALTEVCDRTQEALEQGTYRADLSSEFHCLLADATHNKAISMLARSLREPMAMSLDEARTAAPIMGAKGLQEHRDLIEAIRAGEADAARSIMVDHLDRTASRIAGDPTE